MPDPKRSSRRQKIEPLNYAEAALAPALKGMTSFLDVSPSDVRNGTFEAFGPTTSITGPGIQVSPGDETSARDESGSLKERIHIRPAKRDARSVTSISTTRRSFPLSIPDLKPGRGPGLVSAPEIGTHADLDTPQGMYWPLGMKHS